MAGPIGPSTGWLQHLPGQHPDSGDALDNGAAAANGVTPATADGSALANGHGTSEPAPGLDPAETGRYSSVDGRQVSIQGVGEQANGNAAVRPDAAPRAAGGAPVPVSREHSRTDGAESKMDHFRDRARSQKDEARRQFEERRMRLKVCTASCTASCLYCMYCQQCRPLLVCAKHDPRRAAETVSY